MAPPCSSPIGSPPQFGGKSFMSMAQRGGGATRSPPEMLQRQLAQPRKNNTTRTGAANGTVVGSGASSTLA